MQSIIESMVTEATCGEACWCANEDVCKCSCGGKNHGILRTTNGIRPDRTSRIDGVMYKLIAAGKYVDIATQARDINQSVGYKEVNKIDNDLTYHYYWQNNEPNAPARVKSATQSQIDKWPELTAYRSDGYNLPTQAYLLWQKVK